MAFYSHEPSVRSGGGILPIVAVDYPGGMRKPEPVMYISSNPYYPTDYPMDDDVPQAQFQADNYNISLYPPFEATGGGKQPLIRMNPRVSYYQPLSQQQIQESLTLARLTEDNEKEQKEKKDNMQMSHAWVWVILAVLILLIGGMVVMSRTKKM